MQSAACVEQHDNRGYLQLPSADNKPRRVRRAVQREWLKAHSAAFGCHLLANKLFPDSSRRWQKLYMLYVAAQLREYRRGERLETSSARPNFRSTKIAPFGLHLHDKVRTHVSCTDCSATARIRARNRSNSVGPKMEPRSEKFLLESHEDSKLLKHVVHNLSFSISPINRRAKFAG